MATIDAITRRSAGGHRAPDSPAAVRVLVLATQPLAAYGLRALVDHTDGLAWCGAAPSADHALAAVRRLRPHVVLVDSRLDRDARGIHALHEAHAAVRVIGLVHDNDPAAAGYLHAARAARVNGLVSQSAAPDVVIAAIRAAHCERPFLDPQLARLVTGESGVIPAQSTRLTQRQSEILRLIAHGFRNAEIAEELGVSTETIRTHAKQIMHRLAARDRAHAVARGYHLGLLSTPDPVIPRSA